MFRLIRNLVSLVILIVIIVAGWYFYKNIWPTISQKGKEVSAQVQQTASDVKDVSDKASALKDSLDKLQNTSPLVK